MADLSKLSDYQLNLAGIDAEKSGTSADVEAIAAEKDRRQASLPPPRSRLSYALTVIATLTFMSVGGSISRGDLYQAFMSSFVGAYWFWLIRLETDGLFKPGPGRWKFVTSVTLLFFSAFVWVIYIADRIFEKDASPFWANVFWAIVFLMPSWLLYRSWKSNRRTMHAP